MSEPAGVDAREGGLLSGVRVVELSSFVAGPTCGLPHATGPAGSRLPANQALPAWDLLCGLHVAVAVLACLRARSRDHRGHHVSVALKDRPWFAERDLPQVTGALAGTHVLWAPFRTFTQAVADGLATAEPILAVREEAELGPMLASSGPARVDGAVRRPAAAPVRGADTQAVLQALLGRSGDG